MSTKARGEVWDGRNTGYSKILILWANSSHIGWTNSRFPGEKTSTRLLNSLFQLYTDIFVEERS